MSLGRQFVKFGLVGAVNTALHYGAFLLLLKLGVTLLVASAIGYTIGLINSFLMNRSWTFQVVTGCRRGQFMRFVVVNLIALGCNLIALAFLVDDRGLPPAVAQLGAIGLSLVVNFSGNRWWVFRGRIPGIHGERA